MLSNRQIEELIARLQASGESVVRRNLANSQYNRDKRRIVEAWLAGREEERSDAHAARAENREERSLALARVANVASREANRLSRTALIVAIVSAAVAVLSLLRGV